MAYSKLIIPFYYDTSFTSKEPRIKTINLTKKVKDFIDEYGEWNIKFSIVDKTRLQIWGSTLYEYKLLLERDLKGNSDRHMILYLSDAKWIE